MIPGDKRPLTSNGVLDATTDEAQIRAWWKDKPSANIGIATGRSGLVVIDLDTPLPEGFTLDNLTLFGSWLPRTVTAHTPSGGRHLLYAYTGDDIAPGTAIFGKGSKVDVRAANSYIVAAPSIHPNGGVYKWDKDAHPARTELAPLPAALVSLLTEPPTNRATQPSDEPDMIEDGQDEYGARRAAQLAAKGFSKDEARATLGAMIETRFAGGWAGLDARRPWKAKDVERWLEGAYAKFYDPDGGGPTDSERIADLMGLGVTTAGGATPNVTTPNVTQGAMSRKAAPEPVAGFSAAELQGQHFEPIKWVIGDLLPEGASILGGKPKVGKSWLVLGLASAVASDEDYAFGEMTVSRGEVLYLALEDGKRRLQRRLKKLLGDSKRWSKRLTFFTEWPRVDNGGIEQIEKWIDEHPKTQLVVIDTLKHIEAAELSKGQGGYRADYQSITPLQHLAQQRGIAILIVTHLRKLGSDDPIDTLQGTLGLSGGIDNFYVFTRPKGSVKGTLYYRGRDVDEGELALIWREGDSMLWRLDNTPTEPSGRDVLLEAIKPGEEVTPRELSDRLTIPYDTARMRLSRLEQLGQVEKVGRGKYRLATSALLTV